MKLSNLMMIFLALILFAGAATSVANAQNQNQKVEKEKDDDDDADDSPEAQKELAKQAKIPEDEARRIALQRVSGEILESELDRETGKLVYEFEIRDKSGKIQEVLVDAQTGEIVSVEEENEDDDDADKKVSPEEAKQAKISMEEAKSIALKRVDGSILEEELERENGRLQYAFDIRAADGKIFDVEIDAMTGEVLQAEEDDDEDGDNEDNQQSRQTKKKNVFVRTANSVKNVTVKAVGKIF